MKIIRQSEATECGLASLCMVANHHGHDFDLAGLRQRFDVSLKGASLRHLIRIADDIDLSSRAVRCEPTELKDLQLPAILHWDLNHFVVLEKIRGGRFCIIDPAKGARRLTTNELSKHFSGVALEVMPTARFAPIQVKSRTRLRDLWSSSVGIKRGLTQVLLLSILIQVFVIVAPLYLQLVIDHTVSRSDKDFLVFLALGFAFVHVLNSLATALRSHVILLFGQSLSFQMTGNVMRHLARLPFPFFEKRTVGDIISRIGSVQPIQKALTQSVIGALFDGVMAITTAVLLMVYSWKLAMVVFAFTFAYVLLWLVLFPRMRQRQEEVISAAAKEQTFTIESVRGNRAISLFGREAEREAGWRNRFSDFVNANIASGGLDIALNLGKTLLYGLQLVVVVYIGALLIISGAFSIGMLFAFMTYRLNFVERVAGLVLKGNEFRLLGLHLERLADIVHTKQEAVLAPGPVQDRELRGAIELTDITFRYGANEEPLFRDLSLTISPGEFVAVTGPSGGGKTTLLKIILGLHRPEAGAVLIDGMPLQTYGLRTFREKSGVVMQDDTLLSGTIADNISFFDPEVDMSKVQAAAKAAHIHRDIMNMPMKYLSLIGDMGSALSGGQRQRLLIARALYREPRAIFLDEGTANLDQATESAIADWLSGMPITRLVIAHRPELIGRAETVYSVSDREITLVRTKRAVQGDHASSQPVGLSLP